MRYQNNRAYENPYRQYQQSYNPYNSYFPYHPITGLTREEEEFIVSFLLTEGLKILRTVGWYALAAVLRQHGVPNNVIRVIQRTIIELGNNSY